MTVIPFSRTVYLEKKIHIIECASCQIDFGIGDDFMRRRREDHKGFYCPNGHSNVYNGPSEAEKRAAAEKKRADRLLASLGAQRDQAEAAQREAAESKASEIRLRWRVGNGVCPCCKRTFPALAAHVATKHPEFVHHDLDGLSTRMRELLATVRVETEAKDAAVIDAYEIGAHMGTVRALVNRGLLSSIDYHRIALTEAGWPLAEQAAAVVEP